MAVSRIRRVTDGLVEFADHAVAAHTAAPTAIAFFGVRRASEVAQLLVGDVMAGRH